MVKASFLDIFNIFAELFSKLSTARFVVCGNGLRNNFCADREQKKSSQTDLFIFLSTSYDVTNYNKQVNDLRIIV